MCAGTHECVCVHVQRCLICKYMYVSACLREAEIVSISVCVCMSARVSIYMRMCICVRLKVFACIYKCVCEGVCVCVVFQS